MLTKPRRTSKLLETSMYSRRKHRRFSPLLLVGLCVPILLALIAGGVFILPRLGSHAAAVNADCTLIVPSMPLTAQGLATPYQLVATDPAQGPCNEANAAQAAFVQGAIIDPTGKISVYNPLVVDQGTQPAIKPTVPQLAQGSVVALWFGFNGNNLTLQGTMGGSHCVNGVNGSIFGQFAYCNAPAFFRAANRAIRAGNLTPPALGMANDGQTCMSVRDFGLVDMDQSDNVTTIYLVTGNGQTAQMTAANAATLQNTQPATNASDNRLLDVGVDGALGCQPWMAPNLADPGNMVPALPLNELQAAAQQAAPIALVPAGDPMVLNNNQPDLNKTNAYRRGVDQQPAAGLNDASTTTYCNNLLKIGPARLQLDMQFTQNRPSPDAAAANSLFTFLAQRFSTSFGPNGLNCTGLLNLQNPITLTTDGNGVATAATINPTPAPANANNGNGQTPAPTNGNNGNGQTPTPVNGNGGNGQTPTPAASSTAQGTATFNLDPNAGNVNMALNITYPNHPNQAVKVNVRAGSCTGSLISTQSENLDGQSANNTNTVINNVQDQALPNNWFFTVADPQQTGPDGQQLTVGCGSVVANGTTGTATLGPAAQQ